MDKLKPIYNINPTAGNSKGFKHTFEAKNKMKGRKLTDETKNKLKSLALGRKLSEETKLKMSISRKGRKPTTGIKVEVTDINSNVTTSYKSIRQAAKGIGIHDTTLADYKKKIQKMEVGTISPYRNQYIIKFLRAVPSDPNSRGED